MTQFACSKGLNCWVVLSPNSDKSAGKKKSARISRLDPQVVQYTHVAVKSTEKSPHYHMKCERIYKHLGKKHAILAISRMMLTAIYLTLSTGEFWNLTDFDMPDNLAQKQKEKALKQTTKLLIAERLLSEYFAK